MQSRNDDSITATSTGLSSGDLRIALISGLVAGLAGIVLSVFIIRAVLKRKRAGRHTAMTAPISRSPTDHSPPRHWPVRHHQGTVQQDGTAHHLLLGEYSSPDFRGALHDPRCFSKKSSGSRRYSCMYLADPGLEEELPHLPHIPLLSPHDDCSPALPLSAASRRPLSQETFHTASPSSSAAVPERRSMQNSPKYLPRLVIPNAAVVPKSAAAITIYNIETSSGHFRNSSSLAYSQPSDRECTLDRYYLVSEEGPPPVPPIPDFIVVKSHASDEGVALGRTDTVGIAFMLQARAQRISGLPLAAAGDVSRMQRWDSVKHGTSYSLEDENVVGSEDVSTRMRTPLANG